MNDLSHDYEATSVVAGYRLDAISTAEALQALKPEWQALHRRDPDAGVFLSYDWLEPGLLANPQRWRIFVVRDAAGKAVCIFPTKQRLHWSTSYKQLQTEIEAAGRLAWGEYTGFVCCPDREAKALTALARGMAAHPWKSLSLRYETTRRRAETFAEALGEGFSHRFRSYRINKGTVDNLVGLSVPLLGGFDEVMRTRISANTRQKIRRQRRKLLDSGTYRITTSTQDTVERDIAGLLRNWIGQWAPSKGQDDAMEIADRYGRALLTAESMGCLYLPVLWEGDRMLGALGHVIDAKQSSVTFLVAGRNARATDPAIGLLLHAHAIEWAAEAGYETYDFGHGNQDYKQSFGPEEHRSHYLTVRRSGDKDVLDPVSLAPALKRLGSAAKEGDLDKVQRITAQLVALVDTPASE